MQGMVLCLRLFAWLAAVALALPAMAAGVDPGADERFVVGDTTIMLAGARPDRILPTEVWYPARYSGRDAPIRRGRFPLVLVAHGHCGLRTNYTYLTTHLASWGFVVAAPDFPGYNKAAC